MASHVVLWIAVELEFGLESRTTLLCYRDINNLDVLLRLLLVHPGVLDLMNNVQSLRSSAEYGMFLV